MAGSTVTTKNQQGRVVYVCPRCDITVERMYDPRGHYCPEAFVEGEGRHFVVADVFPVWTEDEIRERLLTSDVIDAVSDEWSDGDGCLASSAVRSIADDLLTAAFPHPDQQRVEDGGT